MCIRDRFDTDPFRIEEGPVVAFGFQAFLPLSDELLIYTHEVQYESDGTVPYSFFTPGFGSKLLLIDSLSTPTATTRSVLSNDFIVLNDTIISELVGYVPHPDGGWWGITKSMVSNRFPTWYITADTLTLQNTEAVGKPGFHRERAALDLTFRPKGDAFAISGSDHGLDLYFFDRNTGAITLWDEIDASYDPNFEPYTVFTRCAWSADGRYLYVTSESDLYQFDTEASDIAASAVQINAPDNIPFRGSYRQIERGPDCRLYLSLIHISEPTRPY